MERVIIFNMLQLLVSLYAVRRGGAPERITAIALVIAALATYGLQRSFPSRFYNVEGGVLMIDLALFGVLIAVALHADRWWTLWVAAMQGLGAGAHLVKALNPDTLRVVYAILSAVWSYPIIVLLFLGTVRHCKRVASGSGDLDWSMQGQPRSAPISRGEHGN